MPDDVKKWKAEQRTEWPEDGFEIVESADGPYVLATDYDRLRAERDALAASHGMLVEVADMLIHPLEESVIVPKHIETAAITALRLARDLKENDQ